MARLLSVNVGLPRDIAWKGRAVHTAIWKNPVTGRCRVGRLNIEGDGQGDLAGHGGEQRAVFVFQIESYCHWQEQLKRTDLVHGQFGENFTVEGLPDDAVCIGDRYQIGGALFEITQPRVTCYRVGMRMNEPTMPALPTSLLICEDWSGLDLWLTQRRVAVSTSTFSIEVITLPVSDVERAIQFYVDQVGFTLDVDYSPNDAFRVVQLTPPGSSCSIQIGNRLTGAPAGSLRNVYLVVKDLEAARSRLRERGVRVGEIRHKTPIGAWD